MTYNRHYCYSIVFADGCTYFGVRTCRYLIADDNGYTGSPVTHAAKWLTDMPKVKTVVSVHATRRLANEAEAKLISDFWAHSKSLSLNASIRGVEFSRLGTNCSDETKAKLSEANTGKKRTAETKAKIAEASTGRPVSDETKAKMAEANTGTNCSDETRAKLSEARSGNTVALGRKWYTDGTVSLMLKPEAAVPDGFRPGRTKQIAAGIKS